MSQHLRTMTFTVFFRSVSPLPISGFQQYLILVMCPSLCWCVMSFHYIMLRWNMMQQKLATRLEVARGLLTFWNAYSQQKAVLAEQLQGLEDQARELVKAPTGHERSGDEVYLRIQECQVRYQLSQHNQRCFQ